MRGCDGARPVVLRTARMTRRAALVVIGDRGLHGRQARKVAGAGDVSVADRAHARAAAVELARLARVLVLHAQVGDVAAEAANVLADAVGHAVDDAGQVSHVVREVLVTRVARVTGHVGVAATAAGEVGPRYRRRLCGSREWCSPSRCGESAGRGSCGSPRARRRRSAASHRPPARRRRARTRSSRGSPACRRTYDMPSRPSRCSSPSSST